MPRSIYAIFLQIFDYIEIFKKPSFFSLSTRFVHTFLKKISLLSFRILKKNKQNGIKNSFVISKKNGLTHLDSKPVFSTYEVLMLSCLARVKMRNNLLGREILRKYKGAD